MNNTPIHAMCRMTAAARGHGGGTHWGEPTGWRGAECIGSKTGGQRQRMRMRLRKRKRKCEWEWEWEIVRKSDIGDENEHGTKNMFSCEDMWMWTKCHENMLRKQELFMWWLLVTVTMPRATSPCPSLGICVCQSSIFFWKPLNYICRDVRSLLRRGRRVDPWGISCLDNICFSSLHIVYT